MATPDRQLLEVECERNTYAKTCSENSMERQNSQVWNRGPHLVKGRMKGNNDDLWVKEGQIFQLVPCTS